MTSRSASRPLRVHIENSRALQPVFIVQPHQLDAALARHADLAPRVRITIGFDGENYEDLIRDADALIGYRFAWQALRRQAPALKWIQVLGAGVDYMAPFDWLPPGIVLTTNSGAHVAKAAESATMALLMLNAGMPELIASQRRRVWNRRFTTVIAGKRLLLVGVGHIGGAVADRTAALGMEVIGIRRSARPHPSVHRMHSPEALPALLPDADFVLLCAALTPQTRHLMGADEFARMKPGAGFINLSRGGLVDLQALCAGLAAGRPGGAIVDVTAPEPLPPDSPIWDTPGLVITPHVLSDDLEGYIPATLDIFFDNVRRHLEGRPLRNVVDLERGY